MWHGCDKRISSIVPIEVNAEVFVALEIHFKLPSFCVYSGDKVIESSSGAILDTEIIDDKRELDVVGCIGEKTWDIGILELTLGGEVLDEVTVREVSYLRETIHALVNPEEDSVMTNEGV